jgi:hypothetical protein
MSRFGIRKRGRVIKADIHELMIRWTLHSLLSGSMALKESPFQNTAMLAAPYDMEKQCDCGMLK